MTGGPAPSGSATSEGRPLPGVVRLSLGRTVVELKAFMRSREAVVFTFSFPMMMLILFASIFTGEIKSPPGEARVTIPQTYVAGMLAAGIVSTTFTSLAISIAMEQHAGLLKRLGGTPLPKGAYFAGKMGMALATTAIQAVLMVSAGLLFYGVKLPADPARWAALGWVTILGITSCSLLGIAFTRLIPNQNAAAAIVQPPYIILQFISGVFIPFRQIPGPLQAAASLFPLRWMALGYRYVFLPDWFKSEETGNSWSLWPAAAVLTVWTVVGFVLCVFFFRWTRRSEQ